MYKYYWSFIALISAHLLSAQTFTLSGRITEVNVAGGIPNAYVFLENTKHGTTTDGKGFFKIADIRSSTYTLVVSSEGFTTIKEEITIESDLERTFVLKENLMDLPQLVVESQTLSLGRQGMKEIPGSVQYISPKELKNYNYTNINDVMKMVPGVNIQEEEGFGLRPNIGLRGSGLERSARVTIMEDGILAAPAPYASPSAYYFPTMGRMNSIEVLKGSSQVRFGPFTTGGAINFMSSPIPNDFSTKFQLTTGSFGYRNLHAFVGNRFDQVGFLVETFQYGADGFKTLPGGQNTGFDKKDYQLKFSVNTKADASIYQILSFTAGQTNENSNETYLGLSQQDFDRDPYQRYAASQMDNMAAGQTRLSARHYIEIPHLFNIVTTAYRNEFQRNWYKLQSINRGRTSVSNVLENPATYDWEYDVLTGNSFSDTTNLKVRANNREYYSQGVQTVFDIEFETGAWEHDLHISGRLHEDQEDRFQWEDGYAMDNGVMKLTSQGTPGTQANRVENAKAFAGYVFYKLNNNRLAVTPGIRYENVTISREDFGKNDVDRQGTDRSTMENHVTAWLPGVGVNYSIVPGLSSFAGVHRGFAPPGSKEDTKPESSINYELGVRKFKGRIEGTLVLYYNDYRNLLGRDVAAAGGVGTGDVFNAGTAVTQGVELQLSTDLLGDKAEGLSLPVSLSYTLTDAFFTTSYESDLEQWQVVNKGDKLPYVALHQFYFSVGVQHRRANLFLNTRYQSDNRTVPGQGEIVARELVEGFIVMDVSANVFLNKYTSFNLSVNNLLDNEYAVARRPSGLRPGMPRSMNLGVKVNF